MDWKQNGLVNRNLRHNLRHQKRQGCGNRNPAKIERKRTMKTRNKWRYAKLTDREGNSNLIAFDSLPKRKDAIARIPGNYNLNPLPLSKVTESQRKEVYQNNLRFYNSSLFIWCLEFAGITLKSKVDDTIITRIDAKCQQMRDKAPPYMDEEARKHFENYFKPLVIKALTIERKTSNV